jgi:molecular chaperone DnaJ
MAKNHFAILEVTTNACPAEIRSAYRRLAKAYHPDHYRGDSRPFQRIQEAYSVLVNPDKRRDYEKSLSQIRVRRNATRAAYSKPEPLIPERGPVDRRETSPMGCVEPFSPLFDELFGWFWEDFFKG